MGMSTKHTSAANLQKAINNNLITVKSVKVESKDDHGSKTITAEQFKTDLDFYIESGIFADSIDFKYVLHGNDLTVYTGNMSSFCSVCITVGLIVRRHIVGGANRTLISAITSLRSCGIGTCRRLSSG